MAVERKVDRQEVGACAVELGDDDIRSLDDALPRMLLKYGIDCK